MTKTILFSVFVAVIFWSTAILFAQEQTPAPVHKEGDTWQFSIFRKGQIGTSTELNEGMYEVSVTQGVVKLYQVDGGQKIEKTIVPDGPTETFVRLIGKSETNDRLSSSRYQWVKRGPTSTKLDPLAPSLINGGPRRSMLLGSNR
jgi:hypothetical protein